jgi:hypothetical protein
VHLALFYFSLMRNVYPSKIDVWLFLLAVGVPITVWGMTWFQEPNWLGSVILVPVIAFILHLFLTTRYTIEGKTLIIRCGFLYRKKIDIQSILRIKETRNPLSSPATSLDRLEIRYGKSGWVLVSPRDKQGFVNALRRINERIELSAS